MQGKKIFNIGQFLPFIFSVLTFFCLSIGINFGVFQPYLLAVFLMVFPGYYVALLISNEFKLGLDEVILLSFIFSGIMLMFVYMILTLFFINVNRRMLLFSLSLLMFFCVVIYKLKYIMLENELKPNIMDLIGLLFTFCIGLITTSLYMPLQYWRGPDGWENINIIRTISSQSISYIDAFELFRSYVVISNPGFYYYFAAYHLVTGFSVESIMRFGGLFQSGLFLSLIFILLKRYNGFLPAFVSCFLFVLNPLYNERFVVLLRENVSLFLFVTALWLYKSQINSKVKNINNRIVFISIIIASCLITHPMVPLILYSILFISLLIKIIENNFEMAYMDLKIVLVSFIMGMPFCIKMVVPITNFVSKMSSSNLFIMTLSLLFISMIGIIIIKKYDIKQLDRPFYCILILYMFIFPLLSVLYYPNINNRYSYGYIDLRQFSNILVILSVASYFIFYFNNYDRLFLYMNFIVSTLIAFSFIGIPVPLPRLSIPLSLIMVFYVSYFIRLSASMEFLINKDDSYLDNIFLANLFKNKLQLALLLMVVVGGMIEVSDITRKRSTFDSYEIEGTKLFVSGLKPGELVYPYGISDHLLYYTNISRENVVCDFDKKDRLYQIFDMEAPYEISDLIQEMYPNVTKYIFYLSGIDDYYLHQTPFGLLLDDYFERENYASFNSYSLDLPFNIKDIKLRKVKYIQDVSDNLFLGKLDGIKSVSNSVYIKGDSRPIKMLFLMDGTDGAMGLASSIDGIYWALENFTNLEGRIETLYMVEVNDRYLLYASTSSRDQILCYSSYDLINWVNETVIMDTLKDGDFSFIEYPIVWAEDDKFRMLFWKTSLDDFMMHGVHFAESFNGVQWNTSERLEWFLMDSSYHIYSYDKILPTDILLKNEEYVILSSVYMKKLGLEKKWYTCSISLPNITQKTVMYRDFVYKDHVDSRMHSVHLVRDVESSGLRFIYVEEGGGGVFVGAASDHLGLEEEYLELP